MAILSCPKCGHEAASDAAACPDCGQVLNNGATGPRRKPAPPPELSGWVIEPVPPEVMAWARETFDLEEFMADVREIERTGGLKLEDFIEELEEEVRRRERTNQ